MSLFYIPPLLRSKKITIDYLQRKLDFLRTEKKTKDDPSYKNRKLVVKEQFVNLASRLPI